MDVIVGVLYDAINQPEDAIADFEAILKLRKDVAVAHLNLGLIYLTKMDSFQKYEMHRPFDFVCVKWNVYDHYWVLDMHIWLTLLNLELFSFF